MFLQHSTPNKDWSSYNIYYIYNIYSQQSRAVAYTWVLLSHLILMPAVLILHFLQIKIFSNTTLAQSLLFFKFNYSVKSDNFFTFFFLTGYTCVFQLVNKCQQDMRFRFNSSSVDSYYRPLAKNFQRHHCIHYCQLYLIFVPL